MCTMRLDPKYGPPENIYTKNCNHSFFFFIGEIKEFACLHYCSEKSLCVCIRYSTSSRFMTNTEQHSEHKTNTKKLKIGNS